MKSSQQILLIDDSPSERARLKKRLKKELPEHSCQEIANWKEFSQSLAEGNLAAVITDHSLKWNSGLTILSLVLEKFPACPVIFHTANNEAEFAAKAFKAGAKDYILKNPERLDKLAASLNSVLQVKSVVSENGHKKQQNGHDQVINTVIEYANDGIFIADTDTRYVYANECGLKMLGYTLEELTKLSISDVVITDQIASSLEMVEKLRQGEEWVAERNLRRKDGKVILTEIAGRMLPDGKMLGITRDISERKKADLEIAEIKSFYEKFLNDLPVEIAVFDRDGRFKYVNPAAISKPEIRQWLIGKTDFDFCRERNYPIDLAYRRQHFMQKCVETALPAQFEEVMITKSGAAKKFLRFFTPVVDEKGVVSQIIAYGYDITELRRAEQEVQISEERFRLVSKATNDTIWDWQIEPDTLWWSDGLEAMFGYDPAELYKEKTAWSSRVHPDDLERVKNSMHRVINSGRNLWMVEYRFRRADGKYAEVFDRAFVIRDKDQKPVRMIGSMQDITERKIAENLLADERKLFIGGPTVVFKWKPGDEMFTQYVSPNVKQQFGYNPQDFLSGEIKYSELIHPEDLRKIREDSEARRAENPEFIEWEYRLRHADGEYRWVYDFTIRQSDENGNPVSYSGTVLDITERKKIEESLKTERSLFIGGPTVVIRWRPGDGWPVTYISPNVFQQFGYKPSEFTSGKIKYTSLIHPDDKQRIFDEVAGHKAANRETFEQKYRLRHANGEYRWVYDFTVLQKDENGFPTNYAGTVIDITELKHAEEILLEERNVYVTGPAVVCKWLPEPGYPTIFVSSNFKQHFGYDAVDFIDGKLNYGDFVHPDDVSRVLKEIEHHIAINSSFFDQEYRFLHPDGSYRWIYDFTVVIRNEDQSIAHFRGTLIDITERKLAEQALQKTHARINSIISNLPIILYSIDKEGKITHIEGKGLDALGMTPKQIIGRHAAEIYPDEKLIRQKLSPIYTGEPTYYTLDFNGLTFEGWSYPETDKNGKLMGITGMSINITEQKKAKLALEETENRLKTMVSNLEIVFFSIDNNGIFTLSEGRGLKKLGLNPGQVVGLSAFEMYKDFPDIVRNLKDSLAGKSFTSTVLVGSLYSETYYTPMLDNDGNIIGMTGVSTDITERMKADYDLRESRKFLEKAQETGKIGSWIMDLTKEPNTITVSKEFLNIIGIESDVLTWDRNLIAKQLYPDDAAKVNKARDEANNKTGFFNLDYRIIRVSDGAVRWVHTDSEVIFDENSSPVQIFGVTQDITERKLADETLKESEEKYRIMIEHATEAIVVADFDTGKFVEANEKAVQLFEMSREELFQIGPGEVSPTYQADGTLSMNLAVNEIVRALNGELPVFEWLHQSKSGRVIPCEIRLIRMPNDSRKLVRGAITDITERKLVQEELARRAEELARSNVELERFAYVASHDLQEPLRMIASYSQLLESRYSQKLEGDAKDFLGFIVDGSVRMRQLIQDLLAYSRVGTHGKPPEKTNCEDVMEDVMENLFFSIQDDQALITHDPLPEIEADPVQIGQIFQNLISNAIKFRKENEPPKIHVSAKLESDMWLFEFSDNGIGMKMEYAERIFVIFQRLHRRDEYPGTGIGLAICKKIVERHGGQIWVESEEGRGATFKFTIPNKPIERRSYDGFQDSDRLD